MIRQKSVRHAYVEYIPEKLEHGVLYISKKYRTASHLCCCGCGLKVSLYPSIGNWSFPCKSHYWIDHSRMRWAGEMTEKQIANVRQFDQLDADRHSARNTSVLSRFSDLLKRWFKGN
jgi:hypothetical protein